VPTRSCPVLRLVSGYTERRRRKKERKRETERDGEIPGERERREKKNENKNQNRDGPLLKLPIESLSATTNNPWPGISTHNLVALSSSTLLCSPAHYGTSSSNSLAFPAVLSFILIIILPNN